MSEASLCLSRGYINGRTQEGAADARQGLLARPLSPPQHFDLSKFLKPAFAGFENSYSEGISTSVRARAPRTPAAACSRAP